MADLQVIIARYEEPIEWIKELKHQFVIYNKGSKINLPSIHLPNIGREAHTFLHHILRNYNNLPTYTAFLQGNPFDHHKNIINTLNTFPQSIPELHCYSEGCYSLADRHLDELDSDMYKHGVFMDAIYNDHFTVEKHQFHFACGAQYIVHKNNIINKPKRLYHNLLFNYKWQDHEPWSMERVWPMIFNANDEYKSKS